MNVMGFTTDRSQMDRVSFSWARSADDIVLCVKIINL